MSNDISTEWPLDRLRRAKPTSPRQRALKELQEILPEVRLKLLTEPEQALGLCQDTLNRLHELRSNAPDDTATITDMDEWERQCDVLEMSLTNFLADARQENGQWQEAAVAYEKCLGLGEKLQLPDFQAASLLNLGKSYRHAGNLIAANRSFERAIILSQLYGLFGVEAEALYQLGVVAELRGQLDTAIIHFQRGLDLSESLRLYDLVLRFASQLGRSFQSMGQFNEALLHYNRCLKLLLEEDNDPESEVIILGQISHIYTELNEFEAGVSVAERGLARSRKTRQSAEEMAFLYDLARQYANRENWGKSKDYASLVLRLALERKDGPAARRAKAVLDEINRLSAAQETVIIRVDALKMTTTSNATDVTRVAEAHYQRGNQYFQEGAYDRAIAAYSQAVHYKPHLVNAYINRGIAYAAKGLFDYALADYARAISLNPQDPDAYFNRGNAYRKRREYERAIVEYSQAILLDPNDPDPYFNRGEVYRRLRRREEAAADFLTTIELSGGEDAPASREALQLLGEL